MIQIAINKTCASVQHIEPITSGAINAKVQVTFDGSWNGLNKTAVFTNGAITKDVLESQWADGNIISIPHEVLTPNAAVRMGVYGYNLVDGIATAVPSVYVQLAKIRVGADPLADITTDPTLPVYAQLQWEIDHFEISPEQIAEQVQEYLAEHPIEIQPATASVLGGIKVGEGLSVTADGTLSADSIDAYTKVETDALLDDKQPIGDYATTQELDALADIVDGKADISDIPSLDGYATESYVQNYHDNTKQDVITDLDEIRAGAALGATALQSVPNTYRTASAQDVIDNGFVKLVGTAGQTIQTNVAVPLNVKNNIVLQHRAFVGFQTHDDNAIGFIGVDSGKPTFLAADGVTAKALQSETITDSAGYFTTDTVEGALAEIGGTLDGLEAAINTIRGVS